MSDIGPFGFHYESAEPLPLGSGMLKLPEWSGPTEAMAHALELVQRDLNAAGLARYVMGYAVAGGTPGEPIVNVQWRGTWTTDGLDLEAGDLADVTVDVAAQAAQGLVELESVYWPTCPLHRIWTRATVDQRRRAVWLCEKSGVAPHFLAEIGDLAPGELPQMLSRTLDELPPP